MDAFVARQAIFDRNQKVFAYELLFRSCSLNAFDGMAENVTESVATSHVISTGLLAIGLEKLLSGRWAFINFGREQLVEELTPLLPKEMMVIEVMETVVADFDVLEACREWKRRGYLIALDDFAGEVHCDPFIEYADIIKVDFQQTSRAEQERFIRKFSSRGIQMFAEKLETQEEYQRAFSSGYHYFQGYFFAKPLIIRARQIASSKVNAMLLIEELQRPELDHPALETLIKQDVSFSYKLLRYVNSAAFNFRNPVQSIQHALRILGDHEIRRWVTLVALPGMASDKPSEIISQSLLRARFCELMAGATRNDFGAVDPFLLGMLSLVDAMIDRPLDEIAGDLNLHAEMRDALLGNCAPHSGMRVAGACQGL